MRERVALGIISGWMLALVGGCGPAGPRIWAASDMVALTRQTPPVDAGDVWDGRTRTVTLSAAANETVSFQLVIDAGEDGLKNLRLAAGPPVGAGPRAIDAANVRLFGMQPTRIAQYPAWYLRLAETPVAPADLYDALVPLPNPLDDGIDLPAQQRLAVWVDLHVPRDAAPGPYRVPVTIRWRFGSRRVSVALTVYDFVLPDARPVTCIGGFAHETIYRRFVRRPGRPDRPFVPIVMDTGDPQVAQGLVIYRQLMRLAHDHRLDLFDKTLAPLLKRDRNGAVVLGWDDYDAIVAPYLDGSAFDDRMGVPAWPAPLRPHWPDPDHYGGAASPRYGQTASAVLAAAARHFAGLAMSDRLFVWPRTPTGGPGAYTAYAGVGRLVRAAAPGVPVLAELPAMPLPHVQATIPKDFSSLADMYAPSAENLDPALGKALARPTQPLAGLWLRPGRPPYLGSCGLLAKPADVRALPWVAMKYGCTGLFLPEVLNWAPAEARAGARAGDRLFHPGAANGSAPVLGSVRLKRLRRGLQDAAYLWLLRQRRREAVARNMIDTMVHYAALDGVGDHPADPRLDGWVTDGALWVAARKILAEEVLAVIHPNAMSTRRSLALRLAWRQLQQRACRVRLERVRCRVEPAQGGSWRMIIQAELYNERTRPAEVDLRLGPLPPGVRAVKGQHEIAALAGGGRAVVTLIAESNDPPAGTTAKVELPLVMTTDRGERTALAAEVAFLRAGHVGKALAIDGDLSDWVLRRHNTAGAFRLSGRRGRTGVASGPATGPPRPQAGLAKRQTAVFVLHDDANLYLAFRCDEPTPQNLHARADNTVRYEELMACAEDLVEVIVDPARNARSSDDLYHLVVKSNGIFLAERGVATDPPLGRARPWAAGAKVAVTKQADLWIVEAAIPLAAFGPRDPSKPWGINFTRFATTGSESASWSGAARYFYDPRDLGTMVLTPKAQ